MDLQARRKELGLTRASLARAAGIAYGRVVRLEYGEGPVLEPEERASLAAAYQVDLEEIPTQGDAPLQVTPGRRKAGFIVEEEDGLMIWERRARLSRAELKALGLPANPFPERPRGAFWWPEMTQVFEETLDVIEEGGMVALVAPSGAGKSTLLRAVRDRLEQEGEALIVDLASTDRTRVGAWTVETSILDALGIPQGKIHASGDRRVKQLARLLSRRAEGAARTIILCDDFHDITGGVLKTLRRLRELDSRYFLFSCVFAGQEALGMRLRSEELREIGGRTQLLTLPALGGRDDHQESPNYGQAFLEWHLAQIGVEDVARYFTPEGAYEIAAMAGHPLWVRNLAIRCLQRVAPLRRPVDLAVVTKVVEGR